MQQIQRYLIQDLMHFDGWIEVNSKVSPKIGLTSLNTYHNPNQVFGLT